MVGEKVSPPPVPSLPCAGTWNAALDWNPYVAPVHNEPSEEKDLSLGDQSPRLRTVRKPLPWCTAQHSGTYHARQSHHRMQKQQQQRSSSSSIHDLTRAPDETAREQAASAAVADTQAGVQQVLVGDTRAHSCGNRRELRPLFQSRIRELCIPDFKKTLTSSHTLACSEPRARESSASGWKQELQKNPRRAERPPAAGTSKKTIQQCVEQPVQLDVPRGPPAAGTSIKTIQQCVEQPVKLDVPRGLPAAGMRRGPGSAVR